MTKNIVSLLLAWNVAFIDEEAATKVNIPIVYVVEDDYVMPTIVSMESAVKNINNTSFYEFIIMVTGGGKDNIRFLLSKFQQEHNDKCIVQIKEIAPPHGNNDDLLLIIPQILSDKDKLLYLTSDTLVRHDLKNIFETNIDREYLGGFIDPQNHKINLIRRINKHAKEYISSCVLLMNCKNLRQLTKKIDFLQRKKRNNNFYYSSQDILNIICGGKIKVLPSQWILFDSSNQRLSTQEEDCGKKKPLFINYVFCKPWITKSSHVKLHREWYMLFKTIKNKYKFKDLEVQSLWLLELKKYLSSIAFDVFLLISSWILVDIKNPTLSAAFSEVFIKTFFSQNNVGFSLTY